MEEIKHDVKVENLEGLKRKILISYDVNAVEEALRAASIVVGKKKTLKGFRQGTAPANMVRHFCKEEVNNQAKNLLAQTGFLFACKENKLVVLREPNIEDAEFNIDGSFSCNIFVEVRPHIDVRGYVGLELKRNKANREALFQDVLSSLKHQYSTDEQIEVVEDNSIATADFMIKVGEKIVESGDNQPFYIREDKNPPFGRNMIGMEIGKSYTYQEILKVGDYAGQTAEVQVNIKGVMKKKEPSPEDLVKMTQVNSYEELENAIRAQVNTDADNMEIRGLEEQAVDKLLEIHQFDVPEDWVADERKFVEKQLKMSDTAGMEDTLNTMALRNIKRSFLIDAIYEEEPSLKITEQDLTNVIEAEAKAHNVSTLVIKKEWSNKKMLDSVIAHIKNKKVLTYILTNAQFIEDEGQEQPVESEG